jgi:hypothetical protein
MEANGRHMPSMLLHLAQHRASFADPGARDPDVLAQISSRLAKLIDDARSDKSVVDNARNNIVLTVLLRDGTEHPASSLSDGTLRFIALSMLEADSRVGGIVCLEEPENGIHPERMPAMIELLEDMAVSTLRAVNEENPLRQVVINTHSPVIVGLVSDGSLLFVKRVHKRTQIGLVSSVSPMHLEGTWRDRTSHERRISRADIRRYLRPLDDATGPQSQPATDQPASGQRVAKRPEYTDQGSLFAQSETD